MEQKGKDLVLHQADLSTNKEFKVVTNCGFCSNVIVSINTQDASVQQNLTGSYELCKQDAKLLIAFLQVAFDL